MGREAEVTGHTPWDVVRDGCSCGRQPYVHLHCAGCDRMLLPVPPWDGKGSAFCSACVDLLGLNDG